MVLKRLLLACMLTSFMIAANAQDEMWDKSASGRLHPNIRWFKEAKFGMFIHWGLYSKLGGVWNNKRYYGSGEWLMNQAKIPARVYAAEAATFNPVNFDADAWASLAAAAGIRYMVITAKHHEGFAMYDSKVSDFTIVKSTPYKKDPMKALGPDGKGNIPYYSVQYLKATGKWLQQNGESIYGTTYGFMPAQPWGVTTAKPGKLYLHVLDIPANGQLLLPGCTVPVSKVYTLAGKRSVHFSKAGNCSS